MVVFNECISSLLLATASVRLDSEAKKEKLDKRIKIAHNILTADLKVMQIVNLELNKVPILI